MDLASVNAAIASALATAQAAQEAKNQALQDELALLRAAASAPSAATSLLNPAVFAAAVAAAMPVRTSDHSRDLEKFPPWSSEETGSEALPPKSFLRNLTSKFTAKGTPPNEQVNLAVERLRGKALSTFEAFTNAAGDTGSPTTTTFTELEKLILSLQPDEVVESQNIEKAYEALSQKGSAAKMVESYKTLVARIKANTQSRTLHTDASLIRKFVMKLKPGVQVHILDKTLGSLEDAYSAAQRADDLVFAASKPTTQTLTPKRGSPFPSPSPYGSRQASPGIPLTNLQVAAMLSSVGLTWDGQATTSPRPATPTPKTPSLAAVERDHSVPVGQPIPKMTPEIKAWCLKWRACFRCRQKDSRHPAVNCPRFSVADANRSVTSMEESSEFDQPENE